MWPVSCGLALLSFGAMLVLQGCGGGGSGSSDTTNTKTTTTTTTTTSPPKACSGFYCCQDLPTYYKVTYGKDGVKTAAGQCLPSKSPGAYYTQLGEKDSDGKSDRPWGCFAPDFDRALWTDAEARAHNFEGACLIKDYGSPATPGSADVCSKHLSHHPAVCAPGPSMFWGACWSGHSENWKCVPANDPTIDGLAKGDCKANVLLQPSSSVPTQYFFDGVCRFAPDTSPMYKCDTVPSYNSESAATCGQKVDITDDRACFSVTSGVQWECLPDKKGFPTPCDWTLQPGATSDFYKGQCVFPGNKQYKDAIDAHNLTETIIDNRKIAV